MFRYAGVYIDTEASEKDGCYEAAFCLFTNDGNSRLVEIKVQSRGTLPEERYADVQDIVRSLASSLR